MSSIKERLYLLSGYSAGSCIVIIMLIILTQILGRMLGFIIPSAEDISGYLLAASIFFGLAYTFKEGGHIRVTILIRKLSPKARYIQELLVLIFGLGLALFIAWYSWFMVWESHAFEEVTQGYIPMPLWVVQIPVGLGATGLLLAVADALYTMVRGQLPDYTKHEEEIDLEDV